MKRITLSLLAALALASPATANAPSVGQRALTIAQRADRRSKAAIALVKGIQPTTGAQGVTGPQGAPGTDGRNGTNGLDGARGPQGEKGDTGSQGPAGPAGGSVHAFGYVDKDGTDTTTQGATVASHSGVGIYCLTAPGIIALTVTPTTWGITPYVLRPGTVGSSCESDQWLVVLQGTGVDAGFTFIGQ